MIGHTISHYRIIEKLGEGGMGSVYVAEDTRLGRRVAIKFPHGAAEDDRYHARFLREARAVSNLSHPHIATLYDYGETETGQPFIVMELVKGETLTSLLSSGKLTLLRAVEIVRDVAKALNEAHRLGVVHRDIKPSNILINERGEVKVLDFGLVKHLGEDQSHKVDKDARTLLTTHTQSGVVIGTPLYLSPEQAKGAPVDARSDLFTLGAVLYECVTGKPAFSGASVFEIAAQVIHVDPKPPSAINSNIPPDLDRLTLKALAKKPEARYQSAAELVEELEAVRVSLKGLEHAPTRRIVLSHATSRISALSTFSDIFQRPRLPIGIAILGLLVAGGAVLAIIYALRPTPYKPTDEAVHWYEIGTNALRDGTYFKASKALELAVKADEKFALAHARLAEAWTELDYTDKAKDELLGVTKLVPDRSILPSLDALYLQAVMNTVSRDFKGAIESYRDVVSQVPEKEKPYAYVDLGRAYEKNEEVDKAIESYLDATRRDSQYATAFLRVGILYGRKKDQASAAAALAKAESLYQVLSNYEGLAEVFYQRGTLSQRMEKIDDARQQLQRALEITRTTGNEHQQIRTLLRLSAVSRIASQIEQAKQYASDAVELARTNGMENLAAQGLIDLGNVYYRRSDTKEAEKYFNQALEFAQRNKGRRGEATALLSLGSLLIQQDKADEGLAYVEKALPFFQQGSYRKEASQALLLVARANQIKGNYEAALQAFEQQLQLAQQEADQSQISLLQGEIGSVLAQLDRYPDALSHYDQSYAISTSLGNRLNDGYNLMNRGHMLWRLGRYQEAQGALGEASAIAEQSDSSSKQLSSQLRLVIAQMAFSQGRFADAIAESKTAMALDETPTRHTTIAAKFVLGLAKTRSGAKDGGKQACQQAAEMATHASDPRLLSDAMLALGEALLESGDAQSALATARQAEERYSAADQPESEWRARLIAGIAGQRLNNRDAARENLSRARNTLLSLQQKWGVVHFNSYLTRPDIQFYSKQLDQASIASQ